MSTYSQPLSTLHVSCRRCSHVPFASLIGSCHARIQILAPKLEASVFLDIHGWCSGHRQQENVKFCQVSAPHAAMHAILVAERMVFAPTNLVRSSGTTWAVRHSAPMSKKQTTSANPNLWGRGHRLVITVVGIFYSKANPRIIWESYTMYIMQSQPSTTQIQISGLHSDIPLAKW